MRDLPAETGIRPHQLEAGNREHYAFLNEGRVPWLFMASLFIVLKGPSKGAVVFGAPQRQHQVSPLHVPPGPGALEPHMADELVG